MGELTLKMSSGKHRKAPHGGSTEQRRRGEGGLLVDSVLEVSDVDGDVPCRVLLLCPCAFASTVGQLHSLPPLAARFPQCSSSRTAGTIIHCHCPSMTLTSTMIILHCNCASVAFDNGSVEGGGGGVCGKMGSLGKSDPGTAYLGGGACGGRG